MVVFSEFLEGHDLPAMKIIFMILIFEGATILFKAENIQNSKGIQSPSTFSKTSMNENKKTM